MNKRKSFDKQTNFWRVMNTLVSFRVAAPVGIQVSIDCIESSTFLIPLKFCPFPGLPVKRNLVIDYKPSVFFLTFYPGNISIYVCFMCFYFILRGKNMELETTKLVLAGINHN